MKRFGICLSTVSLSILTGCGGREQPNFTEPKQRSIYLTQEIGHAANQSELSKKLNRSYKNKALKW
jgi:hypothetical protein